MVRPVNEVATQMRWVGCFEILKIVTSSNTLTPEVQDVAFSNFNYRALYLNVLAVKAIIYAKPEFILNDLINVMAVAQSV
jgi:hypothetical protein